MNWFGTSWGAAVCHDPLIPHVQTPVGAICLWCDEPITADDSGIGVPHFDGDSADIRYHHVECWMRSVLGSVGHQLKLCSCYGGPYEDPPTMTRREAARAAWENARNAFPPHS